MEASQEWRFNTNCIDPSRDTLVVNDHFIRDWRDKGGEFEPFPMRNLACGGRLDPDKGVNLDIWLYCSQWPTMKAFTVLLDCPERPYSDEESFIPYMTEIDSELQSLSMSVTAQETIRGYIESARAYREQWAEFATGNTDGAADVTFNVSVVSYERVDEDWYHERIQLPPIRVGTGTEFCKSITHRPMRSSMQTGMSFAFDRTFEIPCRKGGTIISPYEGLPELFQESTNFKNISEEEDAWINYGGSVVPMPRYDRSWKIEEEDTQDIATE